MTLESCRDFLLGLLAEHPEMAGSPCMISLRLKPGEYELREVEDDAELDDDEEAEIIAARTPEEHREFMRELKAAFPSDDA
jgi:hypothetical protein